MVDFEYPRTACEASPQELGFHLLASGDSFSTRIEVRAKARGSELMRLGQAPELN